MKIYITRISRRIKNLREEKNLTQEALADQLGISRQSIISVEKGKCLPSLPLALKISEIFNSTLEDIFLDNKNLSRKEGSNIMPRSLMPWSPFGDLDNFFNDNASERQPRFRGIAFPAINVKQTDKNVVLTADIPGIKEDEIQVEIADNFVEITGERKEEIKEEDEGYSHQEIRYGSFARRIPLPAEIQVDKADASIKDGLLTLTMPKIQASKPKVTKIKVKKG